jgi:restriction endonuclease S subunit
LDKEIIQEMERYPVFGGNGIQGYSNEATHHGFVIAFGRVGANCGSIHWSYEGAWLNNNSSSIVPNGWNELILQQLLEYNFNNLRGGAAQPFISNGSLASIELALPPNEVGDRFCATLRPIRLQQVNLNKQTTTLRRTRDLLLPRLMSGRVELNIDEE